MLKNDSYKNVLVLALLAVVMILLVLLFAKDRVGTAETVGSAKTAKIDRAHTIEVFVPDKPLEIPDPLQKILRDQGVKLLIVAERDKVAFASVDGKFFELCGRKTKAVSSQSAYREAPRACTVTGLGETLKFILGEATGCGRCVSDVGFVTCNLSTNRYFCAGGQSGGCGTVCE